MGFKYRVRTKIDTINELGKSKYYAVPVRSGLIDLKYIADILEKRSSLSKGDIISTIVGLVDVLQDYLKDGYNVRIDDLGIFSISVSSDGFEDPEQCKPHKVRANKICFRADSNLRRNLKFVRFERET